VAADRGSAAGVNTTSEASDVSKIADCAGALNANTWPAGAVFGGGDTAAVAAFTVAGVVSINFDEHPLTTSTTASIPHTVLRIVRF
jgi:hypothetical protein